jgi:hypothetical protein
VMISPVISSKSDWLNDEPVETTIDAKCGLYGH